MADLPWVRFFPSDWLAGTRGLSAAEIGVYISLVAMMYERGAPLPEDHEWLRRLCGATRSQFEKALAVLVEQGKVVRMAAGLWNKRVDQEHGLRIKRAVQNKEASKKRWQNPEQKQAATDANGLQMGSDRITSQISKKERYLTTSETLLRPRDAEGSPALGALRPRRALTEAERAANLKAALERNAESRRKAEGQPSLPTITTGAADVA